MWELTRARLCRLAPPRKHEFAGGNHRSARAAKRGINPSMSEPSTPQTGPVRVVAVLGAGTMGHGIAQIAAAANCEVRLFDVSRSAADDGVSRILRNLDKGVDKGKVTPEQREQTLQRLTPHDSLTAAVQGADLVVEAVPERLKLKQELLAQVAKQVATSTVLATNTSSLSVASIATAVPHPERVIGAHFFNPVHIMKLLEVIVPEQTSRKTSIA